MTLTQLIVLGLAAWVVWEWLLLILPFQILLFLQPLLVLGLTYGLQQVPDRRVLPCLAGAAVVAILHIMFARRPDQIMTVPRGGGPARRK